MQDYPLEELGPRAFEQLTVALAMAVIGNGVSSFGSGPDGGREATYTGSIDWSATGDFGPESWEGYTVIQAKQREHRAAPADNLVWLAGQVSSELDSWFTPGESRNPVPDYFIFVTNVRLSSAANGGIDQIDQLVRKKIQKAIETGGESKSRANRVRGWKIWHRDQLNALLSVHSGVRSAFPGMLTAGDLLERLASLHGLADPTALHAILARHAESSLAAERWVNFSEAGGTSRASLEEIAVDLRHSAGKGRNRTILRSAIRRSDAVLKRSLWPAGVPRHLVITGRAGSGKSTTTRFLTQVLRCNFLADEVVSATPSRLIEDTTSALERIGAPLPKNRRWPVRVDLPTYADALGPSGDKDLVRWIAELVSARAGEDIKPFQLRSWINRWPTAVLLDGLDEVTSPQVRARVIDEIRILVEHFDRDDADAFVVITTRPTGYTEQIMPEHFSHVELSLLGNEDALAYGQLVTKRRLADDPDRRDQVVARLKEISPESPQGRLMGTPLQVLIMTLILDRFGVLPPDRYQLFARYFDTVLERESAKTTSLKKLLTDHKRTVIEVHELAGLELQRASETNSHARGLLTPERLRAIAETRLASVGFDEDSGIARISSLIVQTATERLVLLVPGEDDCFSFEVRSLQELMAAKALSRESDEELEADLAATAHSPHWRNTWVFCAGKAFADGSTERRELVVRLVEGVDTAGKWPGWLCPTGPELASELLADGMSVAAPKWQKRLVDVALRALTGPPPIDTSIIAAGLSAASPEGKPSAVIGNALRDARQGSARARAVEELISRRMTTATPTKSRESFDADADFDDDWPRASLADIVTAYLDEIHYTRGDDDLVDGALDDFKVIKFQVDQEGAPIQGAVVWTTHLPRLAPALLDPDASEVLRGLVGRLGPELWFVERTIARIARMHLSRLPAALREAAL